MTTNTEHPPVDHHSWRTAPASTENVLRDLLRQQEIAVGHLETATRTVERLGMHADVYRVIANQPASSYACIIAAVRREHRDWHENDVREAIASLHSVGVVRIDGLLRKRLTATYWPVSG